jgi:hypothetical protein
MYSRMMSGQNEARHPEGLGRKRGACGGSPLRLRARADPSQPASYRHRPDQAGCHPGGGLSEEGGFCCCRGLRLESRFSHSGQVASESECVKLS